MPLAGFSGPLAAEEKDLKRFLYARLYGLPELQPVRLEAERVVGNLAVAYKQDPALLPAGWQRGGDDVQRLRTIGDFVAGMTDRFALSVTKNWLAPSTSRPAASERRTPGCHLLRPPSDLMLSWGMSEKLCSEFSGWRFW